jgi:hypothetical protein
MGRITPIMNYIRRVLIEDIYGRLSKIIRTNRLDRTLNDVAQLLCSLSRRLGWPARMSRLPALSLVDPCR